MVLFMLSKQTRECFANSIISPKGSIKNYRTQKSKNPRVNPHFCAIESSDLRHQAEYLTLPLTIQGSLWMRKSTFGVTILFSSKFYHFNSQERGQVLPKDCLYQNDLYSLLLTSLSFQLLFQQATAKAMSCPPQLQ